MKERVSIRLGTKNVLFVAPHGHDLDDTNTGIIAMAAADFMKANAVVNNGWRRSKTVDELASKANCNDLDHCSEDVVKAEFFDPIVSSIESVVESLETADADEQNCYIFMVHGIGNSVRTKSNDPNLELIVGFGAGDPPRYTCEKSHRECFMDLYQSIGTGVYAGAPGGAYSARSYKNMTQAIHRLTGQPVMQLEYIYEVRKTEKIAEDCGYQLGRVITAMLKYNNGTPYARPAGKPTIPEI